MPSRERAGNSAAKEEVSKEERRENAPEVCKQKGEPAHSAEAIVNRVLCDLAEKN